MNNLRLAFIAIMFTLMISVTLTLVYLISISQQQIVAFDPYSDSVSNDHLFGISGADRENR